MTVIMAAVIVANAIADVVAAALDPRVGRWRASMIVMSTAYAR